MTNKVSQYLWKRKLRIPPFSSLSLTSRRWLCTVPKWLLNVLLRPAGVVVGNHTLPIRGSRPSPRLKEKKKNLSGLVDQRERRETRHLHSVKESLYLTGSWSRPGTGCVLKKDAPIARTILPVMVALL